MRYAAPGETGSLIHLQSRYGNFINGEFVPPVNGNYFVNTTPINGSTIGEFRARISRISITRWPPRRLPLTRGAKPRRRRVHCCC